MVVVVVLPSLYVTSLPVVFQKGTKLECALLAHPPLQCFWVSEGKEKNLCGRPLQKCKCSAVGITWDCARNKMSRGHTEQ